MKLELKVTPVATFPKLNGPHKLAWNYLLDLIFAEAYHAEIGRLNMSLPSKALVSEVKLRAALTAPLGDKLGVAMLGVALTPPPDTARVFTLAYGSLAPKALRVTGISQLEGWQAKASLSVLTWQVKALGLSMNVLNQARAPHFADPAMFAMRRSFIKAKRMPAYYHLHEWIA